MIPISDNNPTRIFPVVTWALLISCVAAFFWQLSLDQSELTVAIHALGVIPAVLLGEAELASEAQIIPAWASIFTSMFLHGGWMHLIGNMLYLWIFADNVEESMGHGRFLVFYLLCGVVAALVQTVPSPQSTMPMIGASGAISGVLGAYLLLYPWARVTAIVPLGIILYPVRIPAVVVLLAWFGLQLLSSAMVDPDEPGVAFYAHAGGFVAGMILVLLFRRRTTRLFSKANRRR